MKIRIQGNSIRLRLSQTEVNRFGEGNSCEEKVSFPNGNSMTYRVVNAQEMDATFDHNIITIMLPESEVKSWANTDKISMQGNLALENEDKLSILVEKDFKCLTARGEDESDLFPNPKESH